MGTRVPAGEARFFGDPIGCVLGPWPPSLAEMSIEERGGRYLARFGRPITAQELIGPRAGEVDGLMARLDQARERGPSIGAIAQNAARAGHAQTLVDAFVAGVRRSSPMPNARLVLEPLHAAIRALAQSPPRLPAVTKALGADIHARAKAPPSLGGEIAAFAAVARLLQTFAAPLFRGAIYAFPSDRDVPPWLVGDVAELTIERRMQIVHTALDILSDGIFYVTLRAMFEVPHAAGRAIKMPTDEVLGMLLEMLRLHYPLSAHSEQEVRCAVVALPLAWCPVSLILSGMMFALSSHVANLVLRPKGSFDLWGPWTEMIELGLAVVGHETASRFLVFDRPLS